MTLFEYTGHISLNLMHMSNYYTHVHGQIHLMIFVFQWFGFYVPGQDKKLQEWWQTSLYTEVNFNMEDRFLDKYTQANSVDSD